MSQRNALPALSLTILLILSLLMASCHAGTNGQEISGGTLLAVGSSGMAEAPANQGQAVWSGSLRTSLAAGTYVGLVDKDGQVICAFRLPRVAASFVYSSPTLVSGDAYTLVQGGSGEADADGQVSAESYSGYAEIGSLTAQ